VNYYRISSKTLDRLDRLEGYYGEGEDNHYLRVIQTLHTDKGIEQAYVYVYTEDKALGLEYITFGDWKYHQLHKRDTLGK
jgi:gamma-glutamylcyclotransferase (GGCT)/AIG2-like uncharacterized protein YtfP